MFFQTREEAGILLAKKLAGTYGNEQCVVYGLPRGGVITAAEISKTLHAPLSIIIVRKIGHPFEPEYALAVISEHGHVAAHEKDLHSVAKPWFNHQLTQERQEIKRRQKLYLRGNHVDSKDKVAILADDGIATGLTIKAGIEELKDEHPKKIVVAVPVIPRDVFAELKHMADDVVALDIPKDYAGAVGSYYAFFPQVTDKEVIEKLDYKL